MRTLLTLSAAALLTVGVEAGAADAIRVESARFDGACEDPAGGAGRLRLAGAGLFRWGWFVKVYAAAHYVDARAETADPAADIARRLELVYFVGVTARDLAAAAEELLARSHGTSELAPLRDRLDRVRRALRDVRPGDRYALSYVPGRGTLVSLNGEQLVEVEGRDFARAYFGIWLGEQPMDRGLRKALLADAGHPRLRGPGAAASARR